MTYVIFRIQLLEAVMKQLIQVKYSLFVVSLKGHRQGKTPLNIEPQETLRRLT